MKIKLLLFVFAFLVFAVPVAAHSGRTDSQGGHNCRVGACAGTYHYHNGGVQPPPVEPTVPPVVLPTKVYVAPTKIYIAPTRKPYVPPTKAPTPTSTPTPTETPTPTIKKEVKAAKTEAKQASMTIKNETPKGFWAWVFSIFN